MNLYLRIIVADIVSPHRRFMIRTISSIILGTLRGETPSLGWPGADYKDYKFLGRGPALRTVDRAAVALRRGGIALMTDPDGAPW